MVGRSQEFICGAVSVVARSACTTGSELGLRWSVRVLTISVLMTCLLMINLPRVSGVSSKDVATAITTAEKALQAAFANVSDTERAGINVSSLLSRLDEAGAALTMAEANSGDYSEAMSQAAASEALAEGVSRDAIALKNGAGDSSSILIIFLSSFAVAGVFLVVLALTWLLFKRHYYRKLSESHPGVVTWRGV